MKIDIELGDALLRCEGLLRRLAASLPPGAEVAISLARRELTATIYMNDAQNNAYRFVKRMQPGESEEFDREELAQMWALARYKLGLVNQEQA